MKKLKSLIHIKGPQTAPTSQSTTTGRINPRMKSFDDTFVFGQVDDVETTTMSPWIALQMLILKYQKEHSQ